MRAVASGAAGLLMGLPAVALAQAWTPSAGTGALSVSFQTIANTGHRLTDGIRVDSGRSRSHAVYVEVDYGLSRRWAITSGIPIVWARYTDDDPPPPFLPFLPVDQCRCWHRDWQDVSIGARFGIIDTFDHVTQAAVSVTAGVPSHAYDYRGEAVVGRRLRELRLGLDVARRVDWVSSNLSVSGRYAYAIVERVLDVPNNRSNAAFEAAYRLTPPLSARAFVTWQRTHGGLRAGSLPGSAFPAPGDLITPARIAEHDRLLRDNRTHWGAGISYVLVRVDLFATYTHFGSGTDTHAGFALTAGINLPFGTRR